jgi:HSP20 family protein
MSNDKSELISFPLHLSEELERLFDEMIHRPWGSCREIRGWSPAVDFYGTDDAFILEADLPGVKSGEVQVAVEGGDLILQGSRSVEISSVEGRFHVMERSSGHFLRVIKLPEAVDKDAVQVDCRDGVLRIVLPKAKRTQMK